MVVNEEDQMIFDNIEEYVQDENRVVSYKWLSLNLSIHVNKSKRLLEDYYKNKPAELHAVYFIGGIKKDEDESKKHEYCIVKEEKLAEVKESFEDVTSCHIYSLQKCDFKDSSSLFASDADIVKEKLPESTKFNPIAYSPLKVSNERPKQQNGHILEEKVPFKSSNEHIKEGRENRPVESNKNLVKKSSEPVENVNKASKENKTTPPLSFFGKKTSVKNQKKKSVKDEPSEQLNESQQVKKDQSIAAVNSSKSKKSNIANAFSQSKQKSENIKTQLEESKQEEKDNIKLFIENEDKNTSTKIKSKEEKSKVTEVKKQENKCDSKIRSAKRKAISDEEESDDDFETFLKKSKDTTPPVNALKSTDETLSDKSNEEDVDIVPRTPEPVKQKSKKRKKDIEVASKHKSSSQTKDRGNDSENDTNMQSENQVADENDKSKDKKDNTSNKNIPPISINPSNEVTDHSNKTKKRGRRRVLKSKQFIDDDGFMVTKKVYESESCTEEEEDVNEITKEKLETFTEEKRKDVEIKKTVRELEKKSKQSAKKSKHQSSMKDFFKKK